MGKTSKHIRTLDHLEREIYRKQLLAKTLEEKIDHNFEYLQSNYSSLVRNSIFSSSQPGDSIGNALFRSVMSNERLQEILMKVANPLMDKAAEWIDGFAAKMQQPTGEEEGFTAHE
jgi:hypothetical protein